MSAPRDIRVDAETVLRQGMASDPAHSAWVSANAGSGKTHVLTQRVVRLLLRGTEPSRILCLTFTKAAAGEMSNRIFETLGRWAVMDDAALKEQLEAVEQRTPGKAEMLRARTLFARALETPGGLKIQTIHAFCEALLHQFPLEANVPGTFTVMDDAARDAMLKDAKRAVLLAAYREPDGPLGQAFSTMLAVASDDQIDRVLSEAIHRREDFTRWLDNAGGPQGAIESLCQGLGVARDDTVEVLQDQAVSQSLIAAEDWHRAIHETDGLAGAAVEKLNILARKMVSDLPALEKIEALEALLLTKGAPRKMTGVVVKAVDTAWPELRALFEAEAERLVAALEKLRAVQVRDASLALFTYAQALLTHYRDGKRRQGLLDYDDLIIRTADLLGRSSASAWVLYKLDWGIDHLLIDEAQDTSPRQWQIINALVGEFFTGATARAQNRTVFAVGDAKQSIYSFQGAEPANFDTQRNRFDRDARGVGKGFKPASLNLSFRSTGDVLGAVDAVFGEVWDYDFHTAARHRDPGHVEVWPMVEAQDGDDPDEWHEAVRQSDNRHQAIILANRMADRIAQMCSGETLEANGNPIRPGDILVLVRSRDRFVKAVNRALKDRGIAVAGSDRLQLTGHIAISDLMALGRVMLMPQDDLSLAAVLKSPLFDIDEEMLFDVARARLKAGDDARDISLHDALALSSEEKLQAAHARLTDWRKLAARHPVYEFYALVLGAHGGRRHFLRRLGQEAEEVLDVFLARALDHERTGQPGLQAFLAALDESQADIKREVDPNANEVRVMTVHAAKGLEAPIVFLVDKGSEAFRAQHAPPLLPLGQNEDQARDFVWVPSADYRVQATNDAVAQLRAKAHEEYLRLLYVAMTRAEDRLIVCGYKGKKSTSLPDPNWHTMVSHALEPRWQEHRNEDDEITHWVWRTEDSPRATPIDQSGSEPDTGADHEPLPGWLHHRLPRETALPRPLSPSGAQALIDETLAEPDAIPSLLAEGEFEQSTHSSDPRKTGTAIHRLLQTMPDMVAETRWQRAASYLEATLGEISLQEREQLLSQVRGVLEEPSLGPWFDPANSRAEAPVMGRIDLASGPRSVSGTIDRLVVLEDRIVLIDYKTGGAVPELPTQAPRDYVTQMALYRHLVQRLYPEKPVQAALVWTRARGGPKVMQLEAAQLDAAFAAISAL